MLLRYCLFIRFPHYSKQGSPGLWARTTIHGRRRNFQISNFWRLRQLVIIDLPEQLDVLIYVANATAHFGKNDLNIHKIIEKDRKHAIDILWAFAFSHQQFALYFSKKRVV